MSKTEAVCTGKVLIHLLIHLQLESLFFNTFSLEKIFFFLLDFASKPMESLKQIAAYDVQKLLSKSAILSENLLLQLRQSLTKEWGAGSVSTLPEDFVQNLLTEVWFFGSCHHSSVNYIILTCFSIFYLSFFLLIFSNLLRNIYYYFLGFNSDRISNSLRRESCQTEMRRSRKNQNCPCWMQHILSYRYIRGSLWYHRSRDYLPSLYPRNQRSNY